jgi:DNA-binding response OmpR family regulator
LISKEHLLAKVWGEDSVGDDNYIETYMSRIRKMIKKLGSACQIKTVRGLGYKITES